MCELVKTTWFWNSNWLTIIIFIRRKLTSQKKHRIIIIPLFKSFVPSAFRVKVGTQNRKKFWPFLIFLFALMAYQNLWALELKTLSFLFFLTVCVWSNEEAQTRKLRLTDSIRACSLSNSSSPLLLPLHQLPNPFRVWWRVFLWRIAETDACRYGNKPSSCRRRRRK